MHSQDRDLLRARHGRLFELIRQENLSDKRRRRPSEDPLRIPEALALRHAAGESLRPVLANAFARG